MPPKRKTTPTTTLPTSVEDAPLASMTVKRSRKKAVVAPCTHDTHDGEKEQDVVNISKESEQQFVTELHSQLELRRDVQIPSNVINEKKQQLNPCEFYLYYDLERNASQTKLNTTQYSTLLKNLTAIDVEGGRIVYVIIRMFALQTKSMKKMFEMPFSAKAVTQSSSDCLDIEFDLKHLPDKLQHMLLQFTNKHLETMAYDSQRVCTF